MLKGWKTLLFNTGVAVIGVLMAFDWTSMFDVDTAGKVVAAVGVVNLVLRYLTNTPVGKSK